MDAATVEALGTPAGRDLLDLVADDARGTAPDAGAGAQRALGERLRRTHDPALVAAAMTLVGLRRQAVAKLGADASRLVLDRAGLEQATRATVAAHRAGRLVAAGVHTVLDLGCGIGSDLAAMARAGLDVTGVDRDPARVAMARVNLAALGLPGQVERADAATVDVSGHDAVFVDPARRAGAGRVFDPAGWSPEWDLVVRLLTGRAVAKTAPGLPHRMVPAGVEAEWVSDSGDLVEATLWGPGLAGARRRATLLPGAHALTDADDPGRLPAGPVLGYLYEPDDAVTRAGLVTAVAQRVDGRLVDEHLAYVTSDRRVATPFARAYAVVDEVPYRERPLRQELRRRDVGRLTIKKRGVDVVPEQLRRRLALRGSQEATVVLTRVQGRARGFLVEPLSPDPADPARLPPPAP